jgi:hypothetical protein
MEEEKKTKTAEERFADREANNLMNFIIAKTFSRHSLLSEEEYLKEIGFEGSGKTEEEAVRIATFNVITETMNEFLRAKQSLRMATGLMKVYLNDESLAEEDKKEEKGE